MKKKNKIKCKDINAFEVVVDGPLDGVIKGALQVRPGGAPRFSRSNIYKDVQKGAFEVAPKVLL